MVNKVIADNIFCGISEVCPARETKSNPLIISEGVNFLTLIAGYEAGDRICHSSVGADHEALIRVDPKNCGHAPFSFNECGVKESRTERWRRKRKAFQASKVGGATYNGQQESTTFGSGWRTQVVSSRIHRQENHMNNVADAPVRLAGRTLAEKRHVCAFFNSREEQNKILMPFLKEGIDRGEKILRIMDRRLRDEYLSAYTAGGIDVQAAEQNGQLEIRHWHETYLKEGCFDCDSMIRLLEEGLEQNREKYGLTRAIGNMEWALEPASGVNGIVEYEIKLNQVVTKYPDPLVCCYDLNRHSASVVMDILRTHPMVIVGGVLQENPLYVPPEELLQELRERKNERQGNSGRMAEQHIQ